MITIEAGILSKAKTLLNKLYAGFSRLLDKFATWDIDVKDVKEKEDGGSVLKIEVLGKPAEIEITPVEDNDKLTHVVLRLPNGAVDLGEIANNNLEKSIEKELEKAVGSNFKMSKVKSDKTLQVTLQRVSASDTEDSINLVGIFSNYDIKDSMDNLFEILEEPSFIEKIAEEPVSFEIIEEEDSFSAEAIDNIDDVGTYYAMVLASACLNNNLRVIHWNARGEDFFRLHEKLDQYVYMSQSNLDVLGEICMEFVKSAPNPGLAEQSDLIQPQTGFTEQEGFMLVQNQIKNYVALLDAYYVNFTHDVQSELDTIIRFWNNEANYKLERQLH